MASLGPLPTVAGVVKVRHIYTVNTRPAYNVFHLAYTGAAPLVGDCNSVASQVQAAWVANIKPRLSSTTVLTNVEVTDLSSRTGAVGMNSTSSAGTGVTGVLPNNVALCCSFRTAYRFRGGHARMYLPGLLSSETTTGYTWTSGAISGWTTAMAAWLTAINAITVGGVAYKLIMLSYFTHDGSGNPIYKVPPEKYDVMSVAIRTRIDSQRRRLGKEIS